MTARGRSAILVLATAAALALPAVAWGHAALVRESPSASGTVNTPPRRVLLTFSEAVEPQFAIISVTDAAGRQQTTDSPSRSETDPKTLVVPLKKVPEGWYLVFWRAISADGHPVQSAFTFAVGPSPGPQPQFVVPKISETAATPRLVAARTVVFLLLMAAVGLFLLRIAIARPVVRRVREARLRAVTVAFVIAAALGLVAIPVYVDMATAQFALRSSFDVGAIVPLMRSSAFGRAYLDLEVVFALFALAAGLAIWLDRPERERRSVVELLSVGGGLLGAGAALLVPGVAGHAGQTSPRGLAVALDWLHLAAGSVWIGGLIGLVVLWWSFPAAQRVAGLAVCVPRFSNVAFVSVLALIGSGTGAAILHLPTFATLWTTSYGQTLLVKIALLALAMLLASVNLLRTKPRLAASRTRPELGAGAAQLLLPLLGGEVVLVAGAIAAAAVLTSLAPPANALATVGKASAHVGPGPVREVVEKNGYRLAFSFRPNRAAAPNSFSVRITQGGEPVTGAEVTMTFAMLDMEMGNQSYTLRETSPGVYSHAASALVMVGHWGLSFEIAPKGAEPFTVVLVDKANG